jgi:hypothetical protein
MEAIQRRRTLNDRVIAGAVALCVCFFIWWIALRSR